MILMIIYILKHAFDLFTISAWNNDTFKKMFIPILNEIKQDVEEIDYDFDNIVIPQNCWEIDKKYDSNGKLFAVLKHYLLMFGSASGGYIGFKPGTINAIHNSIVTTHPRHNSAAIITQDIKSAAIES